MSMYEYFQPLYKFTRQKGRFGVEIETEVLGSDLTQGLKSYQGALSVDMDTNEFITTPKSAFWAAKHDNSLRNFGVEFVLKKPHDLEGIQMALDEFALLFQKVNFIKNAPATSIHVHVNMQDFSARQMGNFIILWTLFENILVEYSGEPRRSNLFTLPMRCAEGNVRRVVQLFRDLTLKQTKALSIDDQSSKYAAMNLASLRRFCTIEIRCFRGETDITEIFKWMKILNRLYEFAKTDITPPDIVSRYGSMGFDFFYEVFGDSSEDILSKVENPLGMIDRNVFYAAIMADAVADWEKIDPVFEHKEEIKAVKKTAPMTVMTEAQGIAMNAPIQWAHIPTDFPADGLQLQPGAPIPTWEVITDDVELHEDND